LNDKDHIKWDDSAKTKEKGYGFGLSLDQVLADNLGMFARYGWQSPGVFMNGEDFSLEQSWSTGLEFAGSLWGRTDDMFAIAFGQVFASRKYKKVNSLKAESEEHLEAYYSFKANEHITLSPDFQVIWDPYGNDATNGDKAIVLGGLRTQVDF
jgi:carbohydrate-selective porin OprB